MTIPHIVVGATYRVDYVIIAQSRSMVCLSEFPKLVYGAGLFTFYIRTTYSGHYSSFGNV